MRPFRGAPHPFGGSQPTHDRVESRPTSPLQGPKPLRRLRSTNFDLSTVSTDRWGFIPGPDEQPETPPDARTPNLPGEFVSEELRADCTRFLEAIHALVGRRAEMLDAGAETGWVPNPPGVTVDEDVDTPPR